MSLQLKLDPRLLRTLHEMYRVLVENGGEVSIETLAEKLGMNEEDIRKLLEELEKADLVKISDDTVQLNVERFGELIKKAVEYGVLKPEEAEKVASEMEEMAKRCNESESCSKEMEEKARRISEEIKHHAHEMRRKARRNVMYNMQPGRGPAGIQRTMAST